MNTYVCVCYLPNASNSRGNKTVNQCRPYVTIHNDKGAYIMRHERLKPAVTMGVLIKDTCILNYSQKYTI